FEQLVAQRPQLAFLNTARLGACIAGVRYADFGEALRWIRVQAGGDDAAVVVQRHARADVSRLDLRRASEAFTPTAAYARAVLGAALRAAYAIESLSEKFAAENFRDAPEVRVAFEAVASLNALLREQPRDCEILESGKTRMELYLSREAQTRIGPGADH